MAKRTRSSNKTHENAQTPMSMTKLVKATNMNDFQSECDSMSQRKRRKTQGLDNPKTHLKNTLDNSIMYTSHSCGPNIQEFINSRVSMHASTGVQPSYSPYVSNNTNNRKMSQRSKSTNPHIPNIINNQLNCPEGFVNIDLSQLPHDMTQREVVETMIRKHEISNFVQTDEDEDTTRYRIQNIDDRRTYRRSQCTKTDNIDDIIHNKESTSPIDLQKRIILGSNRGAVPVKDTPIQFDSITSDAKKEEIKQNLITDEVVNKLASDMAQNLEYLESIDSKSNQKSNNQDEKKFFLYLNMLEQLAQTYPKLKSLLITLKEGFQTSIRNIVSNEIKENECAARKCQNQKENENLSKMQKQIEDRRLIIEEQEDIIESKDDVIHSMKTRITNLKSENNNLQSIIEKHRINGIQLEEENEHLKAEIEHLKKIEEDILDKCDMLESTDQDMAQALKEIRDQETIDYAQKLEKHSKNVPKLDLERVQEIIRLKCEESNTSYYEEEEEEDESYCDQSDNLSYEIKRYYSERHCSEDASEADPANYKNSIKMLLKSTIKQSNHEDFKEESSKLFDYQLKNDHSQTLDEEQSCRSKPLLENNCIQEDASINSSNRFMLYDDSSSSCESYYSQSMYDTNVNNPIVPKLNLGGSKKPESNPVPLLNLNSNAPQSNKIPMLNLGKGKAEPTPHANEEKSINFNAEMMPKGLGINLEKLKKKDFQEEFMDKYDEFSESWRKLIEQEKRF